MVNRRSGVLLYNAWAASIHNELQRPTSLTIGLSATYEAATDEIRVDTRLTSTTALSGTLQLWVVEDGIVSLQLDGSTRLTDYKHNNVFRGSVNGTYGEPVVLSPDVSSDFRHTLIRQSRWDVRNLRVVAFVSDEQGVQQVAQCILSAE